VTELSRKYGFSWDLLGDLSTGRPNLGGQTSIEVYRLMQFCFRDVMEKHFGAEETDRVFREAGKLAGTEFYRNVLGTIASFSELVSRLQSVFREMGIGVLRVEKADVENGSFVLTVSEDLDCSGLPELDYAVCIYDEGFIAGVLESFSGNRFEVREVDCWCTGDRTCRFTANVVH
jgi:predicted hydrocarbon binding protein